MVSSQIKELEKVDVKMKSEVLEDDPCAIQLTTFVCQPDLDIKQDLTGDYTTSDRLQTDLVPRPIEETEKVQMDTPPSKPLVIEVKEEVVSDESSAPTEKQLVLINGDHLKHMVKPSLLNSVYNFNLSELVLPYNCEDDGFPRCSFKSLYFDEYLKHMKTIHQIDGFGSFSSEHELRMEVIMERWLGKEVGPFQCGYCKKATVTHQEMGRHQAVFHSQEKCLFYYRKFVPNDTVTICEQVNLEDPSFINHLIHLPDQVHLCDFKLTDNLLSSTSTKLTDKTSEALLLQPPTGDPKVDIDQQRMLLDEPEIFSLSTDEVGLLNELDPLCLDEKPVKDVDTCKELQCKWEGCYQTNHSQAALVKHIKKDHIKLQTGKEFRCFWIDCPRISKPFNSRYKLLLHMRIHSEEKPHKCPFQGCNKAFSQSENLKIHQRRHTGDRPYLCQFPHCFKSFASASNRTHHQKTHYTIYVCQVTGCSRKYSHQNGLCKHLRTHTVDEQLEVKRKSVQNKQKKGGFVVKKSSDSSDQRTHNHTLQCYWDDCFQLNHSQTTLIKHIEEDHIKLQNGKEFSCFWLDCPRKSKPYNRKSYLLIHVRAHTGEKPYKCISQGCNKAFSNRSCLKVHQWSHTGERPYLCGFPNCINRFSDNSARFKHHRSHFNTKPYFCQVSGCLKEYIYSFDLLRHLRNHTADEQLEHEQNKLGQLKSVEKN